MKIRLVRGQTSATTVDNMLAQAGVTRCYGRSMDPEIPLISKLLHDLHLLNLRYLNNDLFINDLWDFHDIPLHKPQSLDGYLLTRIACSYVAVDNACGKKTLLAMAPAKP